MKKKLGKGAKYSKKEVLALKALFDKHDHDGSGEVTTAELVQGIADSSLAGRARGAFSALDLNGDGRISFVEYLKVYYPYATEAELKAMRAWADPAAPAVEAPPAPALSEEQLEELRAMFVMWDVNRNGVLERHEMVEAASACGYDSEEFEELFDNADTNHDDALTFDEFVTLLRSSYL